MTQFTKSVPWIVVALSLGIGQSLALADEAARFTPWLRLEWAALRAEHWPQIERLLRA